MNKRIWALVLALAMLLVQPVAVWAEDSVSSDNEYAARGAALIEAIGAESYIPSSGKEVTRIDFLTTLMSVLGVKGADKADNGLFTDVADKFLPAVNGALSMRIVSKAEFFNPDAPIIYRDALKMCLVAAGYEYDCALAGGYPTGVITVGRKSGLGDGLSLDGTDTLKSEDVYALFYNLFNINLVKQTAFGETLEFSEMEGETVLSEYHDVYIIEGIVTANSLTTLYVPDSGDKSFVEINSVKYDCTPETEELIGHNVKAYVKDDGKFGVIAAFPEESESVVLDTSSLTMEGTVITADDGVKEKKYKLVSAYDVIYNGKSYAGKIDTDFLTSCEEAELINNDGGSTYDILRLTDVTYTFVTNVNYIEGIIYTHEALGKNIDLSAPDIRYSIYDRAGQEITVYQLENEVLLQSVISEDGLYAQINVCPRGFAGVITEVGDDGMIAIDGTPYRVTDEFESTFTNATPGTKGMFHPDKYGRIAMYENRTAVMKYGYVINHSAGSGIDSVYKLMLINDGNATETLTLAKKVTLDGTSVSSETAYNAVIAMNDARLIKFSVNGDGLINSIDIAHAFSRDASSVGYTDAGELPYEDNLTVYDFSPDATFTNYLYKLTSNMFWPKVNLGGTKVFIVPSDGSTDPKLYKSGSADKLLSHDQQFAKEAVRIYNIDKYGSCEAIVYKGNAADVNFNTSSYASGVIVNRTTALADDKPVTKLYILMNGTYQEFTLNSDFITESKLKDSGKALCPGDIVRFRHENGVIDGMTVDFDGDIGVMSKNPLSNAGFNGTNANIQYQSGKLYSINSNQAFFTPDSTERIDVRGFNFGWLGLRNHTIPSTIVKVTLEYTGNGTDALTVVRSEVAVADVTEIETYLDVGENADYAVLRQNAYDPRLLVVYKLISK